MGPLRSPVLPSIHCVGELLGTAGGQVVEGGVTEHGRQRRAGVGIGQRFGDVRGRGTQEQPLALIMILLF
jgi:hypothetical protein